MDGRACVFKEGKRHMPSNALRGKISNFFAKLHHTVLDGNGKGGGSDSAWLPFTAEYLIYFLDCHRLTGTQCRRRRHPDPIRPVHSPFETHL